MSEKYAFWVTLRPQSDCCRRGEAEVRILDFKTTWSEFQKANQTATKQGNAERISNQNICSPPQSRSQAVVCVSTPRKYPRSGYFLVYIISNRTKLNKTHLFLAFFKVRLLFRNVLYWRGCGTYELVIFVCIGKVELSICQLSSLENINFLTLMSWTLIILINLSKYLHSVNSCSSN